MVDGIMKKVPKDVIVSIILKFPVKSLVRFKCISQNCKAIIQSSTFINQHQNRTTTATDELILFKRSIKQDINQYKTILSFLSSDDCNQFNPIFPDLDVTYLHSNYCSDYNQLMGPCHGLTALMNFSSTILVNRSTKNYRLLPPSPFNCPRGFHRSIESVGFGFDSIAKDYKIVIILYVYFEGPSGYPEEITKKVEVYELEIDCWRELDHVNQQLPSLFWLPCSQIYFRGSCHWIAISEVDPLVILSFDMSKEIFQTMKMPHTCYFIGGPRYSLVILNDFLTLICYSYQQPAIDQLNDLIDIWIMNDYCVCESWSKEYTVAGLPIESPLSILNGYLLLFQSKSGSLMSYNLNSNEVNELNLHGCPGTLRVIVYKESLISIPRGSEVSTQVEKF
ncbi:hypothetical protein EJD97_011086 [Solanum chilense]|uniref:F-box associated beta-propeller type 1 domain-containing protein n=1 Tax=Solanum chilense TaxID=4083 RepID=A0A6N2BGJ1_SOLCI|nr:hypothetical protein EJD97_011086 [Solanum chilense]